MGINDKILNLNLSENIFFSNDIYYEKTKNKLVKFNLDLVILAWWPYIIKKPLFKITKIGFLNFHPSFLPYNRGKHYYFWNIIEGNPFGVSLHFIDENIDSGPIAFQEQIETSWLDTGYTLREKAKKKMVALFKKNFNKIIYGKIPKIPQQNEFGSFHYGKEIDKASLINLDEIYSGRVLLNLLRARSGFSNGGAWFQDGDRQYEVSVVVREIKKIRSLEDNNDEAS